MSDLIEAAKSARRNAYAPYSGYSVGAAVLGDDGRVYVGCNVENASYPQGVCAEKNAIAAMVVGGGKACVELVLVTEDGGMPCGGCLQTLLEFARDSALPIKIVDDAGAQKSFTLEQLLPHGFSSKIGQ